MFITLLDGFLKFRLPRLFCHFIVRKIALPPNEAMTILKTGLISIIASSGLFGHVSAQN